MIVQEILIMIFQKKTYLFVLASLLFITIHSCKKKEDPGPNEIYIQNKNFYPSQLSIPTGTTITWTNKDGISHTVTSNDNLFDSGKLTKDDKFSYQFTTHGIYNFRDNYYNAVGTIIVQ